MRPEEIIPRGVFVAAGVLIADFTTLVYNLLGGELTVRFLLKVLTVGVIAGATFAYYLWDLRLEESDPVLLQVRPQSRCARICRFSP